MRDPAKREEIINSIETMTGLGRPVVIAAVETWLSRELSDNGVKLAGYVCASRVDRPALPGQSEPRSGAGVAIFVDEEVSFHNPQGGSFGDRIQWCSVQVNDVYFVCVYRAPDASKSESKALAEQLRKFAPKNVVIMGDFNIKDMDWSMRDYLVNEKTYKNNPSLSPHRAFQGHDSKLMLDFGLVQLVEEFTRPYHFPSPEWGGTLLDVVLAHDGGAALGVPTVHKDFNSTKVNLDHYVISGKCDLVTKREPKVISYRKHYRFKQEVYDEVLDVKGIKDLLWSDATLDEKYKGLSAFVKAAYDKTCPLIKRKLSATRAWADETWLNLLGRMKRKRKRVLALQEKEKAGELDIDSYEELELAITEWKDLRAQVNQMGKDLKKAHLDKIMEDKRKYFQYIKQQRGQSDKIGPLVEDGQVATTPAAVAELLAKQYQKNSIQSAWCHPDWTPGWEERVEKRCLKDVACNFGLVEHAIKNMKQFGAPGEDGLQICMLKAGGWQVNMFVWILVNQSINIEGYFPKSLLNSIVTPLYKAGSPRTLPKSYRPVSLSPVLAKVTVSCT